MELYIKTVKPAMEEKNDEYSELHTFLQPRYTVCPYSVDGNYETCRFDNRINRLTCIDYIFAKKRGVHCLQGFAVPYTQDVLPPDRRWAALNVVKQLSDHPPIVAWLSFHAQAQPEVACNYCNSDITPADRSLECTG